MADEEKANIDYGEMLETLRRMMKFEFQNSGFPALGQSEITDFCEYTETQYQAARLKYPHDEIAQQEVMAEAVKAYFSDFDFAMAGRTIFGCRNRYEFEQTRGYTAWQLLSQYHRVPKDTTKGYYAGEYEKQWFYYEWRNSMVVDNDRFQKLKDLYIKKFGGWEQIDLEHTFYDGHAWWDE